MKLSGSAKASPEPMMGLNTTPLIDVMLALLIMFIITIPPQSHQVTIELPAATPGVVVNRLKNEIGLDTSGKALWNGAAVSDGALRALPGSAAAMENQPEIQFRPDAASRYDRVDTVLAIVAKSGVTRVGFVCNNGNHDIF